MNPNSSPVFEVVLKESPGTVDGVVWDLSVTRTPSAPGNRRVTGATVSVDGGAPIAVRGTDAFFEIKLSPGVHSITARAPGYLPAARTFSVTSGKVVWSSMGLTPSP